MSPEDICNQRLSESLHFGWKVLQIGSKALDRFTVPMNSLTGSQGSSWGGARCRNQQIGTGVDPLSRSKHHLFQVNPVLGPRSCSKPQPKPCSPDSSELPGDSSPATPSTILPEFCLMISIRQTWVPHVHASMCVTEYKSWWREALTSSLHPLWASNRTRHAGGTRQLSTEWMNESWLPKSAITRVRS